MRFLKFSLKSFSNSILPLWRGGIEIYPGNITQIRIQNMITLINSWNSKLPMRSSTILREGGTTMYMVLLILGKMTQWKTWWRLDSKTKLSESNNGKPTRLQRIIWRSLVKSHRTTSPGSCSHVIESIAPLPTTSYCSWFFWLLPLKCKPDSSMEPALLTSSLNWCSLISQAISRSVRTCS